MANASNRGRSSGMPMVTVQRQVMLGAVEAQRLFRTQYTRVDTGFFWLRTNVEILASRPDAENDDFRSFWKMIDERFTEAAEALAKLTEAQSELMEENAIDPSTSQIRNPLIQDIEVSDPLTNRYLALLQTFDSIVQHTQILFLEEVYSQQQKKSEIAKARKIVAPIGTLIIQMSTRAAQAVKRLKAEKNKARRSASQAETKQEAAAASSDASVPSAATA